MEAVQRQTGQAVNWRAAPPLRKIPSAHALLSTFSKRGQRTGWILLTGSLWPMVTSWTFLLWEDWNLMHVLSDVNSFESFSHLMRIWCLCSRCVKQCCLLGQMGSEVVAFHTEFLFGLNLGRNHCSWKNTGLTVFQGFILNGLLYNFYSQLCICEEQEKQTFVKMAVVWRMWYRNLTPVLLQFSDVALPC